MALTYLLLTIAHAHKRTFHATVSARLETRRFDVGELASFRHSRPRSVVRSLIGLSRRKS